MPRESIVRPAVRFSSVENDQSRSALPAKSEEFFGKAERS